MPAIIPIPAFSDNYIWLVREGRHAAVVDPGAAAPVLAYLESERLALSAQLGNQCTELEARLCLAGQIMDEAPHGEAFGR